MPWPVTVLPPMRISPDGRRQEAGDHVEQRRLAAAGGTDDAEKLGSVDIEADVLDARHLAAGRVVDQRDVADFDRGMAYPVAAVGRYYIGAIKKAGRPSWTGRSAIAKREDALQTAFAARFMSFAALAATLCASSPAAAQNYPNRPIQMIVAYSAGGTGDVVARIVSDKLGTALGQNIVVENARRRQRQRRRAYGRDRCARRLHAACSGRPGNLAQPALDERRRLRRRQGSAADRLASVVPLALMVPAKAPYSHHGRLSGLSEIRQASTSLGRRSARPAISPANC